MCEVSKSAFKPVDEVTLLTDVIQGALNTRLINDRDEIVDTWTYRAEYGYPIPCIRRDEALSELIPFFEAHHVYSRGRFGMWKYEVSNQDHSFMQGVELIERLLNRAQRRPQPSIQTTSTQNIPGHLSDDQWGSWRTERAGDGANWA